MSRAKRASRPSAAQMAAARYAYEVALDALRGQEALWQAEWEAAPNPFVAVQRYLCPEARARRAPVTQAFLTSRERYEQLVRPARRRNPDQDKE